MANLAGIVPGFNLRLTDGDTTVDLGTAEPLGVGEAGCQLIGYPLAEPGETLRAAAGESDGAAVVGIRRENVSEGATVVLGPAWADCRDLLGQLNRLLRQAEERQEHGRGKPVYLEVDQDNTGEWWRSEVLAGRVTPDGATLGSYWKTRGRLQVAVRWLRRPWWEGPERELTLTTGFGDGKVYNASGGGDRHWFEVDPVSLVGADLASPMRLALKVAYGVLVAVARVVVGGGLFADAAPWRGVSCGLYGPFVEGETSSDGTRVNVGLTEQWSGGAYREFEAPGTTLDRVATWGLPGPWVAGGGREFVRVVARLVGSGPPPQVAQGVPGEPGAHEGRFIPGPGGGGTVAPAGCKLRLVLRSAAGVLWQGPTVLPEAGHELVDLGSLQLPPGNLALSSELYLDLYGAWAEGTLAVDWLGFLPTLNYRRYAAVSGSPWVVGSGESLVDDALVGQLYVWVDQTEAGLGWVAVPGYVARGGPLTVYPHSAVVNRFWVLMEDWVGVGRADATMAVQAWTRPRRSSL